jgi:O-antigen/teichoic acid export membrane protein
MRIVERIRALIRHDLVRTTVVLQIGGVAGTAVQAISGVIIARLLQPQLYGRYALAFSVASISSIFIGGGLTDAVAPAVSRAWASGDRDALRGAIGFYLRFVAACTAVTAVLIALLPAITARLYHSPAIGGYAGVIVAASIISVSVFNIVQLVLQVAGRIRTLAALTFTDVMIRYAAVLALITLGLGVWGAVIGHLIGAVVTAVTAALVYIGVERRNTLMPRLRHFFLLARRARWQTLLKPTLWVLADSNFALLYGALPVAMVGLYAGSTELAYFKLAFGYMILAMSAMGPVSTVMNVHFPTIQTVQPQELRRAFIRVTGAAMALSAGITAVVLMLAPLVFRFLYGPVYLPSVPYVYGLGVFGALFGLGVGLGPMWRALGKVHISIVINLITLGLGVPLGMFLIARWHISGAVAMVTLWYTCSHLCSFLYLMSALKKAPRHATL